MPRVTPGTEPWGAPLNADLTAIEAKADSALAAVASISTASTTLSGLVELATTAETTVGTDTTRAVTPAGVAAALSALVGAAPGTLNTLNELAAALGNDPNFATTIASNLADKISSITYGNMPPGHRTTLLYDGSTGFIDPFTDAVATVRPHWRTDIYFDLIGGSSAVADPAWMLDGDAREIVM